MAVLRSGCLVLGLLVAAGGSARAQCPATSPLQPIDFGGVGIGNASAPVTIGLSCPGTCTGVHATITGPNAIEFAVVANSCDVLTFGPGTCGVTVRFIPQGCGTRTATLSLIENTGTLGCVLYTGTLTGFGCSFDCAINATQNSSLSPTVRDRILRELFLAAGTTSAATRCFRLNCALCLIVPETLPDRAGAAAAAAVEAQIRCLLNAFACAPALPPAPPREQ